MALLLAVAFLCLSVVPVYFVWLVPELFNFSLVLYAVFFWAYKEVARDGQTRFAPCSARHPTTLRRFSWHWRPFRSRHICWCWRPWCFTRPADASGSTPLQMAVLCGAVTAALFAANAAITGEFNYQGGDRKTFYSFTGFPFANTYETFDNIGPVRGREDLMVGDVLVNTHSGTVFLHNLWYFFAGPECRPAAVLFSRHPRDCAVSVLQAEAGLAVARAGHDRGRRR